MISERTGPEIDEIKLAVSEARSICFLGFGYDQTNMKAIGLPESLHAGQVIYGSYLGSTKKEINDVVVFLANHQHGVNTRDIMINDCGCVQLLREYL